MKQLITTCWALLLLTVAAHSQDNAVKLVCVAFYNFENLFDTEDDPLTSDGEFTPQGSYHYTEEIYREKLDRLAEVVAQLGTELTPDGPAILGVCEVENRKVLEDFVAHPRIAHRDYRIVHFESRDRRGIDVALLYQQKYFEIQHAKNLPMATRIVQGDTSWSRDILVVTGNLDGEPTAVLVNHWPSRRGGELATAPLRNAAAMVNKRVVDSLAARGVRSIVMGDMNDDPVNESMRVVLDAQAKARRIKEGQMYNPMYDFYKRGMGTTAYRDAWSLFDQIVLSHHYVQATDGFRFYKARVFNKPWLVQKLGQYKGYPFRTYAGGTYLGGYSDHFPVYVFLVKDVQ